MAYKFVQDFPACADDTTSTTKPHAVRLGEPHMHACRTVTDRAVLPQALLFMFVDGDEGCDTLEHKHRAAQRRELRVRKKPNEVQPATETLNDVTAR